MASPPRNAMPSNHNPNQPANFMPSARAANGKKMGLLHSISPANHGWHGDIRKRFTDFLVNEIRKDGSVLHLEDYVEGERPADTDLNLPRQPNDQHSLASAKGASAPSRAVEQEDLAVLKTLLGDATTTALVALYELIGSSGNTHLDPKSNSIKFPSMEREKRGNAHQEIRRIFDSNIETETDKDGVITAVPGNPSSARKRRGGGKRPRSNQLSFQKLGGDYLHFTLYKENKDTMEAVNHIARTVRMKPNSFGFAGTKDRRAATVQRMSAYRVRHQTLDFLNTQTSAMKMGDYKYSHYPIELGDHGGNKFKITVKNVTITNGEACSLERRVQLTKQAVETAVSEIARNGFINYYGLQRFGTHIIGTHELGKLMLMGDFEAVIDALLYVDSDFMARVISGTVQETPSNRDDLNRARAIDLFKTTKDAKAALQTMPRRYSGETNVIQHLQKNPRDFPGAILTITRGMRNLYLHAYQSFVWNHAASYRWAKYGSKVIPGDLVLVTPETAAPEESDFQRARALSEEEATSGKYSIFDVVLPGPGFDVVYPKNDVGEYYTDFMKKPENGGLDPHHMQRSKKDFSVSGTYRNLLGRFLEEPKWEVRTYLDDSEQMRPTDADLIRQRKESSNPESHGAASTTKNNDRRRQRTSTDVQSEPRVNDAWAQSSEGGSSKRIKIKDNSCPDDPDSAGLKNSTVPQESAASVRALEATTTVRDAPRVNKSSTGDNDKVPKDQPVPSEVDEQANATKTKRPQNQAVYSFTQTDLSGHKDNEVKIAVVLEFGLLQSAYATVVLRELMAEVVPEEPGSPLSTPSL